MLVILYVVLWHCYQMSNPIFTQNNTLHLFARQPQKLCLFFPALP